MTHLKGRAVVVKHLTVHVVVALTCHHDGAISVPDAALLWVIGAYIPVGDAVTGCI